MGIYSRYSAALLVSIIFLSTAADAATRKSVNLPPRGETIKNSTYSFQTPHGEAGYHGRDFVDRHTAGNRFSNKDFINKITGPSSSVPVTLKPTVKVPPAGVASKAIGILRTTPVQIAASAAVGLMLDAIDGVIQDNQVMVPSVQTVPEDESGYRWYRNGTRYPDYQDPKELCFSIAESFHPSWTVVSVNPQLNGNSGLCFADFNVGGNPVKDYNVANISRAGTNCPPDSTYQADIGMCVLGYEMGPATSSDYQTMEQLARNFNPHFLKDLIIASCEGSSNPNGCYDELSSNDSLQGPTTQTTPAQTSTTTTTNPDGTTSTTSTSSQNTYTYNFGPNYYDYSTKTTTTTTAPNGDTTTTVEDDSQPVGEEPADHEEPDYTYANTDFPHVEPFYEQKYPDGFSGAWEARKAEIDNSEFMTFLQSFIPTFSGSCPSFELNLNIMKGANYGIQAFSSLCYVFDFIKAILLVTALFTSRALIFGG